MRRESKCGVLIPARCLLCCLAPGELLFLPAVNLVCASLTYQGSKTLAKNIMIQKMEQQNVMTDLRGVATADQSHWMWHGNMDGEWQVDLKEQLGFIFGRGIMQHYEEKSRGKETTARPAMLSPTQCVQPAHRAGSEGWESGWESRSDWTTNHQCDLGQVKVLGPLFPLLKMEEFSLCDFWSPLWSF